MCQKIILQILHRCCSVFLEIDADVDTGVFYLALIVKVCEYVVSNEYTKFWIYWW
jgi:hypothetical protein